MTDDMQSTHQSSNASLAGARSENFESGLQKTVRWYIDRRDWWQPILDRGYKVDRLGIGGGR